MDYFRGKFYQIFTKSQNIRQEMGLEDQAVRKEIDPQPINLPIDQIKIFEVKGHEIPVTALKAGAKHSEWTTVVEEIRPQDLEKHISRNKHKILAVMHPKDLPLLK